MLNCHLHKHHIRQLQHHHLDHHYNLHMLSYLHHKLHTNQNLVDNHQYWYRDTYHHIHLKLFHYHYNHKYLVHYLDNHHHNYHKHHLLNKLVEQFLKEHMVMNHWLYQDYNINQHLDHYNTNPSNQLYAHTHNLDNYPNQE